MALYPPRFQSGLEQLFNQLVKPRLRSFIDECYKGVTYTLDEDSYSEAEFQDVVRKRFVRGWEALVEPYRVSPAHFFWLEEMTP